jgi:hypothetical protein
LVSSTVPHPVLACEPVMPNPPLPVTAAVLALASIVACRGAIPQAPPAAAPAGSAASPAASSAPPAVASAPAEHHHEMHLPPVGPSVDVHLEGQTHSVVLAQLPHGADDLVPLAAVVQAAYPAGDASRLHVDLVGSDGFRPISRPKCTHLLASEEVAHLRMNVVTHDVSIDEALALPGCYRVGAVVVIDLTK